MSDDLTGARLVLVGPGRAGRAFVRSWTRAAGRIVVAARDADAARREPDEGVGAEFVSSESPLEADVLLLAVSDDAIASVARDLSSRARARFAFHFSGALPASALGPLAADGHAGSLHPLRAFTGAPGEDWGGAFVAVEAEEPAAAVGIEICRRIGARPHRLSASGKPLYHAAATLAAGGCASLISVAARLWADAGLEEDEARRALSELASTAVAAVGRLPFEEALTGPVARRDVTTVRLHRDALAGREEVLRLYAALARETLSRTAGRGAEREIASILGAPAGEAASGAPGDEELDTRDTNR